MEAVQLPIRFAEPEKKRPWGGRRRGAGRKLAPGRRASVAHRARPPHDKSHPVLVTLRAVRGLVSFRCERVLKMFKNLLVDLQARRGTDFRVPHFSIQKDHLHLIVEADDGELTRGIRSLVITFARKLNRLFARKKGKVWGDRYHRRDLRSPTETRNALVYVLNNHLKHGGHACSAPDAPVRVDLFSSGSFFDGWCIATFPIKWAVAWPEITTPRTWFLRAGWRKAGDLLDPRKKPGQA